MATHAHAPATNMMRRYRRVVRLPITGASVEGQVSLVDGDKDTIILGTIAAFGQNGMQSLTSNFGPLYPTAAGGSNVGGPTAPTAAMASTAATANGASTGPTLQSATIASTVNGVATGPIPPTASTAFTANGAATAPTFSHASTASIVNGAATGPTFSHASTASTVNGAATFPNAATASTANGAATGPTFSHASTAPIANGAATGPTSSTTPTANGAATGPTFPNAPTAPTVNGAALGPNPPLAAPVANMLNYVTTLTFLPMTTFPNSNHGLPYELTDLLVSFKEYKGIFKCIRDVHSNTFTELAVVALNSYLREALLLSTETTVAYPHAHIAATLELVPEEEALIFKVSWVTDHMVRFMIKASTSHLPLW